MSEFSIGVNAPPFHCGCRGTTIPYFDDEFTQNEKRAYRGEDGKTHYTSAKNYKEWKEEFVKEKGEKAWNYYEKSAKNYNRDNEQFDDYKNVLGKNAPKSLEEFQRMKYTNNSEWETLKLSYKDKNLQNEIRKSYNLNILEGKQGKHILEHNNYIEGRSYLTISLSEAQELVNKYAGTGKIIRDDTGKWVKKEKIDVGKKIGVSLNLLQEKNETTKFIIHYSKRGIHIVPSDK